MTTYTGNPVQVSAANPVRIMGNPVQVVAPRAFYARFDSEGRVVPIRLGMVTEAGIEWVTPPLYS